MFCEKEVSVLGVGTRFLTDESEVRALSGVALRLNGRGPRTEPVSLHNVVVYFCI